MIGGTFPYTGPAALYKTIPSAEQAFYAYVNAKYHGVHGRKIKDITIDDSYNPAETVPAVKKLVEQDHVFAIVGSLGTAPGLATWGYLNKHKVPQVLLATGDAYWGNCVHHACAGSPKPWTMGWQPDYPGEAKLYAKYILKHKPNAKIGVLYQNDAYGKNYLAGLKTGLGSHKSEIVDAQSYSVTDSGPVISSHVVHIASSGANVFVIFATPTAAITALATEGQIPGWNPLTFNNNVSANRLFMEVGGAARREPQRSHLDDIRREPDRPAEPAWDEARQEDHPQVRACARRLSSRRATTTSSTGSPSAGRSGTRSSTRARTRRARASCMRSGT